MISQLSQPRREPSTGRKKRWELGLMSILKLTHAQEINLTPHLFQINEFEVQHLNNQLTHTTLKNVELLKHF